MRPFSKCFMKTCVTINDRGCWLWRFSIRAHGYGQCSKHWDGSRYAHRAYYKKFIGEIPVGKLVLHDCDVPLCCNPAHLKLGTHKDNTHDMVIKKRYRHPPGRYYNTIAARAKLKKLYADPKFRKLQGRRISNGFKKHQRENPIAH